MKHPWSDALAGLALVLLLPPTAGAVDPAPADDLDLFERRDSEWPADDDRSGEVAGTLGGAPDPTTPSLVSAPQDDRIVARVRSELFVGARGSRWWPQLGLGATVEPSVQAASRLDQGRAWTARTAWSVGLSLTFVPGAGGASRGATSDRAWGEEGARAVPRDGTDADRARTAWRVEAFARRLGAEVAEATAGSRPPPKAAPTSLHDRVLRRLDELQERAQVDARTFGWEGR